MSRETERGTRQSAQAGYTYYVSEEQFGRYATLTMLERLTWLDQARQFVLMAETERTARRRAVLRGETAEF